MKDFLYKGFIIRINGSRVDVAKETSIGFSQAEFVTDSLADAKAYCDLSMEQIPY